MLFFSSIISFINQYKKKLAKIISAKSYEKSKGSFEKQNTYLLLRK